MATDNEIPIEGKLRSPRAAAVAGLIFSILMISSIYLLSTITADDLTAVDGDLLKTWNSTSSILMGVIPFAGIAFLWFIAVIRDQLGELEDQFFATIFLSTGIIFVVMLFTGTAVLGAIFGSYALVQGDVSGNNIIIIIFGTFFMNQILGSYALRMAGVFMFSIGSLWTRTGKMPRWLTILTFVVAAGFLFFAGAIREARYIFPIWVFIVSIYILIENYRHKQEPVSN